MEITIKTNGQAVSVEVNCEVYEIVDGLGEFHFHKLRHTYSSKLIASGAPPKDVQELLGHSDLSTTMNIYTHGSRESKRSAVMLLEDNAI